MRKLIIILFLSSSTFADSNNEGPVTPQYYIDHPASQVVTQEGIQCKSSKYLKFKNRNKMVDNYVVFDCLGADFDAMIDQERRWGEYL